MKRMAAAGEPGGRVMREDQSRTTRALFILLPIGILVGLGVLLRIFYYDMKLPYEGAAFAMACVVGCVCGVLLARFNLYKAASYAWWLYGAFLLLAVAMPWLGSAGRLGALTSALNPSFTLAYLWMLFPVVYGLLLYRMRGTGFLGPLACCLLFAVPFLCGAWVFFRSMLCVCVGSLGCFAVLLAAVKRDYFGCNRYAALALLLLGAAATAFLFCVVEPYRLMRILALLRPETDALGQGWSALRLREVLGGCRLIGQGGALPRETEQWMRFAGNGSVQKDFFLPFLMYRYGLLIAALPIGCMSVFFVSAIQRAGQLRGQLGKVLSCGILTVFAAQAAFSLLSAFGLPLWQSALFPFLSYGNMAFLINLLLVGALLSLFRHGASFSDAPFCRRRLRIRVETRE